MQIDNDNGDTIVEPVVDPTSDGGDDAADVYGDVDGDEAEYEEADILYVPASDAAAYGMRE